MGKKWANNAKEGAQGFQPTQRKPVSPGGKRGFFSRLLDKKENYEPLAPDSKSPLDDWGTGDGFQFDKMREKIEERTGGSSAPSLPGDVTDEYRFGPHAVAHAKIDTKRREVLQGLSKGESYEWNTAEGKETVTHNFNPNNVLPKLEGIAYSVLEESGYFERGTTPKYRGVSGVYSAETIRCAERVYLARGDVFTDQRHSNESTSMFPCEVTKTPGNVSYKYYTHPDVSELIHGVEKDQLNHGKLQAEISEHQGRVSARKAKQSDSFNLSDW